MRKTTWITVALSALASILVAASVAIAAPGPRPNDQQLPLVVASDWSRIGGDVEDSKVPTVVIFSDPADPASGDLRMNVQQALYSTGRYQYLNVYEVPTTAKDEMATVPTVLFVGHAPDGSLVLLNAEVGVDDQGQALRHEELFDFFKAGYNRLDGLPTGHFDPTAGGKVVSVTAAQLEANPNMFAGKKVMYLLGQENNWLRQLELQVVARVSSAHNSMVFVNVEDSPDTQPCHIMIHLPIDGGQAVCEIDGFIDEPSLNRVLKNAPVPVDD